MFVGVDDVR